MVRQVHPLAPQLLQQYGIAALSCAVNVVEGFLFRLQGQEVRHGPVHAGGSQGAPEGHHQRPAVVHPKLPFGLRLGLGEKVLPHRRTGDDDLLRMAVVLAAFLKAHHHPPGIGLQHLGGKAGDHVGLVDRRGDAGLGRRLHQGIAGVAAGAHHHVRAKVPQDGPGLVGGPHQISHGDQVVPDLLGTEGTVEAGDVDRPERVSRLWHQIFFQSPLRAHEQNLGFGVFPLHQLRQGDGRIHMPRRAAAGEDDTMQFGFTHKSRLPDRVQRPTASRPLWVSSAWIPTIRSPFPPVGWTMPFRRS